LNPLLLQFANGSVFFAGMALAASAVLFRWWAKRRIFQSVLTVAAVLGAVFAAMSATPQPVWAYAIWFILFLAVLFLPDSRFSAVKGTALGLVVVASAALCVAELPYHLAPAIPVSAGRPVYVVGDSISAGVTDKELTWPKILGEISGLTVVNLARPGATLKTGLDEVRGITDAGVLVFIELGGNDLLAGADSRAFERQLDELLASVGRLDARVAMFELPLPPLYNAFGAAQRTLAAKHGVTLIPKRYMTTAFGCKGGTIDGLHLSERGHRNLAEAISGILKREP
jgi:acyl-CoA thioesterase I